MGVFRLHAELVRRVAFALAASPLLLAPALTGVSTASAAEPGPVITSLTAGEQVGGEIEVTVESTAPEVLVAWGPEADSRFAFTVPTNEGIATASLSTSGYNGPTAIIARECPSACDGLQTSAQVDVSNPAPRWDVEHWVHEFHASNVLEPLMEEGPWAWYGLFIDGELQPWVSQLPGALADNLGDGEHTVRIVHCTENSARVIEPVVCDMGNASEPRTFIVRTTLHPVITAVRPGTISPDGNGVADSAEVSVRTETPSQAVVWDILQGTQVVAQGSFLAAEAGQHSFTVNGHGTDGRPLAPGNYVLHVQTFITPSTSGGDVRGETSTTLAIDLDAPSVTNAAATPAAFRPGTGQNLTFTGELSEPASRFRVLVLRNGTVVRRLLLGPRPAGAFTTTWDGRRTNGTLMRAGTYRYQFRARDQFGNMAIRAGGTLELRSTR